MAKEKKHSLSPSLPPIYIQCLPLAESSWKAADAGAWKTQPENGWLPEAPSRAEEHERRCWRGTSPRLIPALPIAPSTVSPPPTSSSSRWTNRMQIPEALELGTARKGAMQVKLKFTPKFSSTKLWLSNHYGCHPVRCVCSILGVWNAMTSRQSVGNYSTPAQGSF